MSGQAVSTPSVRQDSPVAIPDFQTIMRPILILVSDGSIRRSRDIKTAIADEFDLSEDERAELLPSGKQRMIDNRVAWSLTHLVQAGLLERPERAHVRITEVGRQALRDHPERIDMSVLNAYPAYREFRQRTRDHAPNTEVAEPVELQSAVSPQDLVAKAEAENRSAVEAELLTRALSSSPREFELLVIQLLSAMGYGRLGQVEHSGRSGDGGIDGIISQDPLGLDRIYVQAKRFGAEQTVTRPVIQGFVGALMGAQGDRGVFITTATFTRGAAEEADRVNARIELIDGHRLAALMVKYAVGVQPESTVTLYEVDEDFFENL
jgi:restriction system protein